jgi:predicted membrane GTPase involved in stress response
VALVAHLDHGKTTLVDGMPHQTVVFRANAEVRQRGQEGAIVRSLITMS